MPRKPGDAAWGVPTGPRRAMPSPELRSSAELFVDWRKEGLRVTFSDVIGVRLSLRLHRPAPPGASAG
jgi:hypothetical protein